MVKYKIQACLCFDSKEKIMIGTVKGENYVL